MRGMDSAVVFALLGASLIHATWHALVKTTRDRVVALAGMNIVSSVTALALLPFAQPLPWTAFAVIAVSVLLHVAYKLLIARLYATADLGQAYPLARGFTPPLAAALAYLALGELPDANGQAAILVVCGGILLLAIEKGGYRLSGRSLVFGLFAGLSVASYSVVDAYGIRLSGDWFSFTVWLVLLDGGAFVAYALASRKNAALRAWRLDWKRTGLSGLLGVISFGIFMWALARAPVGPVTAIRETSVIFTALIGALVLGERASWTRYVAAFAVMGGIAVIALGR